MEISAFDLAERFIGISEVEGSTHNPQILAMLRLDQAWPEGDEVPWCSAFINYIAWLLRLPRSKNLRARSWLQIGRAIAIQEAAPGFDVVVIKRGGGNQPGPEVIEAPGHVGLFAGMSEDFIWMLGGNQSNSVNISPFKMDRLLGVRRLLELPPPVVVE